tara:strand:- start:167 stop:334 length:168 start_codon:yes stop_codon:yes gene_type:complete
MICNICKKEDILHYRVTSTQTSDWIFVCKKCWLNFSKAKGYKYGGTRKRKRQKKV